MRLVILIRDLGCSFCIYLIMFMFFLDRMFWMEYVWLWRRRKLSVFESWCWVLICVWKLIFVLIGK